MNKYGSFLFCSFIELKGTHFPPPASFMFK